MWMYHIKVSWSGFKTFSFKLPYWPFLSNFDLPPPSSGQAWTFYIPLPLKPLYITPSTTLLQLCYPLSVLSFLNYRKCAIITRSWFETALEYKFIYLSNSQNYHNFFSHLHCLQNEKKWIGDCHSLIGFWFWKLVN